MGEQLVTRDRFAAISFGNSGLKLGQFVWGQANFILSVAADDDDMRAVNEVRVIKNDLAGHNGSSGYSHG